MTLQEIKQSVLDGKDVCWKSASYRVRVYNEHQWLITCVLNNHSIDLTWMDEVTMNGDEKDFYILNSLLSNLCYYDERNPDNILDEVDVSLRKDWCACDNCFYGRTKLAEYTLTLLKQIEDEKHNSK